MKIDNIAVIANELQDIFNRIIYDELGSLNGRFSLVDFKSAVIPFTKNRDIDIFLIDASSVTSETDLVEAVKFLRTVKDNMRIIVVAPRLKNEVVISALVSFGVYDIVNPDLSKDDGIRFSETLINSINHSIQSPKSFAMVASMLKASANQQKTSEDNSLISVDRKLRTYLIYKDRKKYNSIAAKFENHERFNLVGSSLLTTKEVSHLNLLKIDLLIVEEPTEDEAIEILNIVKVLKNKVRVIGFFADFGNYESISSVPELSTIVYDGSADDLSRALQTFLVSRTRQITQTAFEGRSKVVAMIGQKGGTGKTAISVLLGHMFSKRTKIDLKVCVVDFNVFAGDLAVKYSIMNPVPNFYVWLRDIMQQRRDNYDVSLLKNQVMNYLHFHESQNVYVLPNTYTDIYEYVDFPTFDFDDINFALDYTIDALKEQFDIVILDTTGYGPNVDIAILKASDIFVVSDGTISGLYQSRALYSRLSNSTIINKEKIKLIINHVSPEKKFKETNQKLAKEFFDGKIFTISYDKELTTHFENMKIIPSRKLAQDLMPVCDEIVPIFKKKKR